MDDPRNVCFLVLRRIKAEVSNCFSPGPDETNSRRTRPGKIQKKKNLLGNGINAWQWLNILHRCIKTHADAYYVTHMSTTMIMMMIQFIY
jgi:hypothetical protein